METAVLLAASNRSIFDGADWAAIVWGLCWAALISFARVKRERSMQEHEGLELTPLGVILPETLFGAAFGLALSVIVPEWWPRIDSLGGVTGLAMLGGFMGRSGFILAQSGAETWFGRKTGGKRGRDNDQE